MSFYSLTFLAHANKVLPDRESNSIFHFRKNSNKESDLTEDDILNIRMSLYDLIKYYISKGMSQEEMHSIIGYIAAIGDEDQVRNSKWHPINCHQIAFIHPFPIALVIIQATG